LCAGTEQSAIMKKRGRIYISLSRSRAGRGWHGVRE
jgi:hypothetical protein